MTKGSKRSGRVALVTGGSAGIGLAIASTLADAGYSVVITGRNQATLKAAARRLEKHKTVVLPVVCDVRDPKDVARLAKTVKERFQHVDVLINNAGVSHPILGFEKLPLETWHEAIATNLTGMFLVTRAMLPLLKSGSAIVNNLSVAAKVAFAGSSAYCASKHGALGFTNVLREEMRKKGIRVIAAIPGATDTAIWDVYWPDAPRKKMMSPASVARAILNAIEAPVDGTIEELTIRPTAGSL